MAFDTGLALSGAGTGASVGSAFGPIGAGVGAVAGLALGFAGQKKPDIPPPPAAVDPAQLAFLEELRLKRTAIESGMSTEFQLGRKLLEQSQAGQLESVSRLTGGDVGGAVAASERVTAGTAEAVSKLTGTATSQAMQYTGLIDAMTQRISERKRDVATTMWATAKGEAADLNKIQSQNLVNALTSPGVTGSIVGAIKSGVDYFGRPSTPVAAPVSTSMQDGAMSAFPTEGPLMSAMNPVTTPVQAFTQGYENIWTGQSPVVNALTNQ